MIDEQNITFLQFAWNSLTEQQQFRINVKYDLTEMLKNNTKKKRTVYRAVADKYGYTMERIEYIANNELKGKEM
jgi:hypothetical protein